MDFLESLKSKESYLDRIPANSTGPLAMEKAALKNLETFCEWKFHVSTENMLSGLAKYQGTKQENTIYEVLQNYSNYLCEERSVTVTVAKNYAKRVKNYLNYRLDTKIHNEDLKQNLRYPREEQRDNYPLSAEEAILVLNHAKNRRDMYLFMMGTGMSDGETLHLKKRDFILGGNRIEIYVPSAYRKVRAPKRTFVPKWHEKSMLARLEQIKDDDPVYRKKAEWKGANNIEVNYFGRLLRRAGLGDLRYSSGVHKITIHSFRSWFITKANRIDHGLGNALAGHGYYQKRYDRYSKEEMLEFFIQAEPLLNPFYNTLQSKEIKKNEDRISKLESARRRDAKIMASLLDEVRQIREKK